MNCFLNLKVKMHSFVFTAYLFVKKRDNSFGISMKTTIFAMV